jgi:PPOX class probable F420-dependent enzyme
METTWANFQTHKYLNLETFRKSGLGVQTPVWFVVDNAAIYVRTSAGSGKVKRIRNNGRARVAPCDRMGKLLGDWVEMRASLVTDSATVARISRLVGEKYGLLKMFVDVASRLFGAQWATIALEPDNLKA